MIATRLVCDDREGLLQHVLIRKTAVNRNNGLPGQASVEAEVPVQSFDELSRAPVLRQNVLVLKPGEGSVGIRLEPQVHRGTDWPPHAVRNELLMH